MGREGIGYGEGGVRGMGRGRELRFEGGIVAGPSEVVTPDK